ncbi:hypothetical protein CC1G_15243 [Coprinopsis cinerea okayama7|uniref:Uncharacterized protein n=1 Tax=Coprinopsis cinerea (strain Okayama-7 / 130 / ATCC MYA-4618 / FGSC 9003) TaxID=240176 RepID=D6RQ68_COPC7|nr:hypothetical protein CC1G_15243 [Coprinopsis cinerea okayama7\|eukprot:XP_002910335.1 hypothetical protein CC1G_15243 [Coprinopsis cinerea okayama7\
MTMRVKCRMSAESQSLKDNDPVLGIIQKGRGIALRSGIITTLTNLDGRRNRKLSLGGLRRGDSQRGKGRRVFHARDDEGEVAKG